MSWPGAAGRGNLFSNPHQGENAGEPQGAEACSHYLVTLQSLESKLAFSVLSLTKHFNLFELTGNVSLQSFEAVCSRKLEPDIGLFQEAEDGSADGALSHCGIEVLAPGVDVCALVPPPPCR